MTDLMDRLAEANPARDDERPPIDEMWRKIDAEAAVADRLPRRRRGAAIGLLAAAAIPVLAVVVIALPGHEANPHSSHATVTGGTRGSHSTIDPRLQRTAGHALAGRTGSIVVMDPRTGAIEALAGTGTLQGGTAEVPPGATYGVVTVATALASGRYGPGTLVSGASPLGNGASQVRNDGGQSFGRVTLSDALRFSVNTVFARVGINLGAGALTRQMRLFRLPAAGSASGGTVAVGPLAAGQGSVTATPLQLASIAAAIANGGRLVEPHVQSLAGSAPAHTVMTARTARLLTEMLRGVVTQGTGTAANTHGLDIAGKTGTAPAGAAGRGTVATFIGFAPADHPTVAIAVVLASPHGGFGGTEAAPIAARVIRDVLAGPH